MELKCEDAQAAYIAIEVKLRKTTTGLVHQKVSFSSRIIIEMNSLKMYGCNREILKDG